MSEPIYRDAPYQRENEATVAAADGTGIRLDRTVFYPRGGGQAGDAGVLLLADGREVAIADTVKGEEGVIVHVPLAGQEALLDSLSAGVPVTARIDWERRHRHM